MGRNNPRGRMGPSAGGGAAVELREGVGGAILTLHAHRKGAIFGAEAPLGRAVLRVGAAGPSAPSAPPAACAACLSCGQARPWGALVRAALGRAETGTDPEWRKCATGCEETFCSAACEETPERQVLCLAASWRLLADALPGLPGVLLLAARIAVGQATPAPAGLAHERATLAREILQGDFPLWWEVVAARLYGGRKRRTRREADLKDLFFEASEHLLHGVLQGGGDFDSKREPVEDATWDPKSDSARGEWLTCATLARVAGFLELRAVSIAVESPLPALCKMVVSGVELPPGEEAPAQRREIAVRLLIAAKRREEFPEASDVAPDAAALSVEEERAVVELSERAFEKFSKVHGVGVFPMLGRIPHSCVPNVQLEATHSGEPGGLRLTLVALRDLQAGESLYVAKFPIAGKTVAQRQAEVRALEGQPSLECKCPRCSWERDGDRRAALGKDDLCYLARQAQEEQDWGEARRMLMVLLDRHDPRNGEALHAIGVCLLGLNQWGAAHAAWKSGLELCPGHPHMQAIAVKDAAYAPAALPESLGASAVVQKVAAAERPEGSMAGPTSGFKFGFGEPKGDSHPPLAALPPTSFWGRKLNASVVPILDDALGWKALSWPPNAPPDHEVVLTRNPVLAGGICTRIVAAAEAEAARRGGWTTARHYGAPTTDLPLHEVPEALAAFNSALRGGFTGRLGGAFRFAPEALRVHDAFIVKYHASKQRALPIHRDESAISLTLSLSPENDYGGGGTFFPHLGRAVRPELGHAVAFRGNARHAGEPITHGTRYIVAAFLYLDETLAPPPVARRAAPCD